LNILSEEYIDLTKLNDKNDEIKKMIQSTLTNPRDDQKTKIQVHFVDEMNANITKVQSICLSIYDGFYCINQILEAILNSCEKLNNHLFNSTSSKEELQTKYDITVLKHLQIVRNILQNLTPLEYRLEILENIYSMIFLSSDDLKEDIEYEEEDELEEEEEEEVEEDDDEILKNDLFHKKKNKNKKNKINSFVEEANVSIKSDNIKNTLTNSITNQRRLLFQHQNSESHNSHHKYYRFSSNSNSNPNSNNNNERINMLRKNGGGGGHFLVNDFLCRDLLLLLKDLTTPLDDSSLIKGKNNNNNKDTIT
jgi:hypothetical protein